MSDLQLKYTDAVKAALLGDENAFSFLYSKTYREKLYLAKRYMKSQEAAEDVLQEAYVKAWKNLGRLSDPEKFSSWLGMIVANTAKDALKARQPMLFSTLEEENEDGDAFMMDIPDEDTAKMPEDAFLEKERSELLKSLTDSLTDEQNMAITMFYIEQLSIKDIAEVMNCSENTVKSRLNYGRKNLKTKVEELRKKGWPLFGVGAVALFLQLTGQEAMAQGLEISALAGAAQGTAAMAGTAAAKASAGAAAAKVTAAAAAGTAAKGGILSSLAGRILLIVGISAAGVGIGVGAAASQGALPWQNPGSAAVSEGSAPSDPAGIKTTVKTSDNESQNGSSAPVITQAPVETPLITETPQPEETAVLTPEVTETPTPEPAPSARMLSDDELQELVEGGLTKNDCELVMAGFPAESSDVGSDLKTIRVVALQINTNDKAYDLSGRITSKASPYSDDVPLSEYNRYLSFFSDIVLTPANMDDYSMSFYNPYEVNGVWYLQNNTVTTYPSGRSTITSAVLDEDQERLLIYYDFVDYIGGDNTSYTEAPMVKLVAECEFIRPTGRYRVRSVHSADGDYAQILESAQGGSSGTGQSSVSEENEPRPGESSQGSSAYDDSWKDVFRSVISQYSGSAGRTEKYALIYIDEDDIPELAAVELNASDADSVYQEGMRMRIYKAVDGKAVMFYENWMSMKYGFMTKYAPGKNAIILYTAPDASQRGKSEIYIDHLNPDGTISRDTDVYSYYLGSDGWYKNDIAVSESVYSAGTYRNEAENIYEDNYDDFTSMPELLK